MSAKGKKPLVPRLRFPEFRDVGEWEEKQLEQVAIFLKGKGIAKSDVIPNGSVPCIRYGELYTDYQESITKVKKFINLDPNNLVLSRINDVIIPASGETEEEIATASCVLQNDIALGGDINIIRSRIHGVFFSYYLNNAKRKDIAKLAQGISVVHLYPSQLKKLIISIPKKSEQQKIAACLAALDDLIGAAKERLDALKQHKQGLMQQLFPAQGEIVPRLRFAEFRDAGEWVEKTVEKLCQVNPKVDELPNEFVYVDLESVTNGVLLKKNIIKKESASSRAQRLLQDKDVIYQMVRPYQKNNYYFIRNDDYDYVASTGYAHLRAIDSSKFLFQLIHTDRFVSSVLEKCIGSNYPAINSSALKQIEVQLPSSKKEQQKIAACLTALDDLIAAQTQKIAKLKTHKRGLMQQLFPAVDEMN